MKRILIATDFSLNSRHTLQVVLDMLKDTKQESQVFLLNTFMVQQTDPNKVIQLNDQLKKSSLEGLEAELRFAQELIQNPLVKLETVSQMGSLNHVVQQLLTKKNIELVAMGKDGGRHVESVTEVLKKHQCRILVTYLE